MPHSHYFDSAPGVASSRRTIMADLRDVTLELTTDTGVFSRGGLDPGTRILLEQAPAPRTPGPILDLGCGYGPIALTWAIRRKNEPVWGTDVNNRALDLARENAESAGLKNVCFARPEEIPEDLKFAAIYSNPPIRTGKAVLHSLMHQWLGRLTPDGSAFLVVQRNLGSDSLMKWLNNEGYPTIRVTSVKGFRILEARPRAENPQAPTE
jgi:16S rRNA (guanine1207-N2)-methyltransferase